MTDWKRVERLREHGASWARIARDPDVGFHPPQGADAGQALRAMYFRRSRAKHGPALSRVTSTHSTPSDRRPVGRMTKIVFAVVAAALVVVVAWVVVEQQGLNQKPTGWVGRAAPIFSLPIANQNGGTFSLASERGQANVLLFFNEGIACGGCLDQMAGLDSDWQSFQSLHVRVVSITGDTASELSSWASSTGVEHTPVLADPSLGVCNEYDTTSAAVSMMPGQAPGHTFILVNMTGVIVWRADYGPQTMYVSESQILQSVQAALPA